MEAMIRKEVGMAREKDMPVLRDYMLFLVLLLLLFLSPFLLLKKMKILLNKKFQNYFFLSRGSIQNSVRKAFSYTLPSLDRSHFVRLY